MKKTIFKLTFLVVAMALQLAAGAPARALTYDYAGNPFTLSGYPDELFGISSFGTSITATVTFDSVVTSTFTGTLTGTSDILSGGINGYAFGGSDTWTGGMQDSFTFVNGQITEWTFLTDATSPYYLLTTSNSWGGSALDTVGRIDAGDTPSYIALDPGTWTLQANSNGAVPEPCTMLLIGSGLVGLAAWRRKFKA